MFRTINSTAPNMHAPPAPTKIPELFRANQGFWFMVSDARTDFAMFCSLVFLILLGAGRGRLTRS